MAKVRIHIDGQEAEACAGEIAEFLNQNLAARVAATAPEAAEATDRKATDPVAVAALILSIPSALLAARDLAERIELRKKITKLIDLARRLRRERQAVAWLETPSGLRDLDAMSPDEVLELAASAGTKEQA